MALIRWTLYSVLLLAENGCSDLIIQQCSPGPKYVYEPTPVQLTCGQCRHKIVWYVKGENDQHQKYVGECIENTCNVEDKSAFRLLANMKNRLYNSVLDIINIPRRDPLYVSCKCFRFYTKYLYRGYHLEDTASCKLITVPISIVPASFSVQLSGWKVSGVCTVQWPDNKATPMCKWSLKYKSGAHDLPHLEGNKTSVMRGSEYYNKRNCTFEANMPLDDGDYTYSVTVPSHPTDNFSKTLRIEQPEVPKHNCPEAVLEGSSINCTCYASKMGNPPAHIAWSESNNEHLAFENVTRKISGTLDVCHLMWGVIRKETVYTVEVMHGPSVINISSYTRTSGNSTETVLVCTAIDVYPSAVFLWNISCDNKTDDMNTSTCTFYTASEEAEMIVECTASNRVFENVSVSGIYVLHIPGNKKPHNTTIITGIAAAVVIISVIGALTLVYIIKQWLVVSKRRTETPVVRYAAPSGDVYTIAGTTIENHGENGNITFRETIVNPLYTTESVGYHQAMSQPHKTNERRKTLKPTIKPKPPRTETDYVNVTELSADSGLDVNHLVPCATMYGSTEPDAIKTTPVVTANDEYNDLHFQVHRSGHEHHDTYYSHLNLK